jgi:hypothetical protein
MKKIIAIVFVLFLFIGAGRVNAQFRYGPIVGLDVSSLSFKQKLITVDQSVGYSAGLGTELMFPGIGFGVDFGILYAQRGATLNLNEKTIWDDCGTPRTYLHYIQIPIHVRFKYTNLNGFEDYVAPFVFGGPEVMFLAAHNKVPELSYSGGDLGLAVGLGAELYRNWQVSASYTWGMTYALKTVKLDNFSARNRSWCVKVAYLF